MECTMENRQQDAVRRELLEVLMAHVREDKYPSVTMLNMIEQLLTVEEVPAYSEMLMSHIRNDRFPSVPLMKRVQALT